MSTKHFVLLDNADDKALVVLALRSYSAALKGAALRNPALRAEVERRAADCERIARQIERGSVVETNPQGTA